MTLKNEHARMACEALDRACHQLGIAREISPSRTVARAIEFARMDIVLTQLYLEEIFGFIAALDPEAFHKLVTSVNEITSCATDGRQYLQALAKRASLDSLSDLAKEYTSKFEEFEAALALLEASMVNPSGVVQAEETFVYTDEGEEESEEVPSATIIMSEKTYTPLEELVRIAQSKGDADSLTRCVTFLHNALTDFAREVKFACYLWEVAQ
ncbi:hypothetical protein HY622_04265 [Candidatus Uhrbacteria bacterium]|nr:hypothetical protein [Candidatus Uhrbacteria bacterium]